MPDPTKPRHEVKVWARADEEQAEFGHMIAELVRSGYTDSDGFDHEADPASADQIEADVAVFNRCAARWHEVAPDVPRDV